MIEDWEWNLSIQNNQYKCKKKYRENVREQTKVCSMFIYVHYSIYVQHAAHFAFQFFMQANHILMFAENKHSVISGYYK